MQNNTFHTLRLRLIELGKDVSAYIDEVDPQQAALSCRLIHHDAPSLVAVVGTTELQKAQVVSHVAGIELDEYIKTGIDSEYRFLHHVDFPPLRSSYPETTVFVQERSQYLLKLSFIEIRKEDECSARNELMKLAEGVIFVVDAKDPWNGVFWRTFENLVQSHAGRFIVCVSDVNSLHKKDWPVLERHLQDKLKQILEQPCSVQRIDYDDLFSIQQVRSFLDDHAIGDQKWESLRTLAGNFDEAFISVEANLKEKQHVLQGAVKMSAVLKEQLIELRDTIWSRLQASLGKVGESLEGRAGGILKKVRSCLTVGAYFRSLAGSVPSIRSLQDGLETILSDTILQEVESIHRETCTMTFEHAQSFKKDHPEILKICPLLDDLSDLSPPLPLSEDEVKREIQKVLRELRLKSLFREQLEKIDKTMTYKLRLGLMTLCIGALIGIFGLHLFGLILTGAAMALIIYGVVERGIALKRFFSFLNEWFLQIGTNIEEPVTRLAKEMIHHSLDHYGAKYLELLNFIEAQTDLLPEQQERLRGLFFSYREIANELKL